ncbi:phage tail protein [Qipengyuania sp. XHP0207]|uniref:phage tail protein n=1 Tax=Qipengyuania sp. XHP0207 TaxID=3038078 RepID=UPI00241F5C8C|nr:phage tail protein [Qipengyuania sp. XHP0207]MDG5748239.1 phage tail protein [Qipengyuania sp. XHP0207]
MATLVIGGLGTLVGGPLGGAVGALIGRQIDGAIFGQPRSDGPRLKDLAISTSSYGQPIARQFGTVRTPGTIIWATDLVETEETSGGGKGSPDATRYSYSVSFAVAVSSRPIDRIGRIWADGNLLRGAAGDMKTAGVLRVHTGHADQEPDPLIAAALEQRCPAHRGCAYVVFENLQLGDFGNRIPALSFEVFAGSGSHLVSGLIEDVAGARGSAPVDVLEGYVHDGGTPAQVLSLVDRLNPLTPLLSGSRITVAPAAKPNGNARSLPPAARWNEGDFGRDDGVSTTRKASPASVVSALRYYDPARDYQPGLQRVEGQHAAGRHEQVEFPGVLSAGSANGLLREISTREAIAQETLSWRMAELDPALQPGTIVSAPGYPGEWRIASWEWREAGIELQLLRALDLRPTTRPSDPGLGWRPSDLPPQPSSLRMFELPWDGYGPADTVRAYAAIGAADGAWAGASLYARQGDALEKLSAAPRRRAISGVLTHSLPPGLPFRFDRAASLRVALEPATATLHPATPEMLARGANRLLLGSEIVQFSQAEPLGEGRWVLSGLLRGRGGTEDHAVHAHPAQTSITLLDERLVALRESEVQHTDGGQFAVIGLADTEPVYATLENPGLSRRPPFPCHGWLSFGADGSMACGWTRRARGGWAWLDAADQPLVEQAEAYEIGFGPPAAPHALYRTNSSRFSLDSASVATLRASHSGAAIWVRQQGSFAKSAALSLGVLPPT